MRTSPLLTALLFAVPLYAGGVREFSPLQREIDPALPLMHREPLAAARELAERRALELGLQSPDLRVIAVRESLTGTHVMLRQFLHGQEVMDGFVSADFDRDGVLRQASEAIARPSQSGEDSSSRLGSKSREGDQLLFVNDDGVAVPVIRRWIANDFGKTELLIDANRNIRRERPLYYSVDRHASLFLANPVTELNSPTLLDQNNAASAVPAAAYHDVLLRDLNASGALSGPNVTLVDIQEPHLTPIASELPLVVDRSSAAFEEEMAYFHIDSSQRYLQALGYVGSRRIVDYSIPVDAHALSGTDNSIFVPDFRHPGKGNLYFGDGGVDDAEDPDIVLHEYGHAIQDWVAPNAFSGSFGSEARALAEGISDYWAFSNGYEASIQTGRDPFCIGDWDARCADGSANGCGYPAGSDCLRRVDTAKTMDDFIRVDQSGAEHRNGEIWSSVLRQLFVASVERHGLEAGKRQSDVVVLESLFGTTPNPSFATAARRLVQSDLAVTGGENQTVLCAGLQQRKILAFGSDCGVVPRGEWTVLPSHDRHVTIPDGDLHGVTTSRFMEDLRTIRGILVRVDIVHPHHGDLKISLIAPDGVPVLLQGTSLADTGRDIHATFGADVQPVETLAGLIGTSGHGEWKLQVVDVASGDVGYLDSWSLFLQLEGDEPLPSFEEATALLPIAGHVVMSDERIASSNLFVANGTDVNKIVVLSFIPFGLSGGQNEVRSVRLRLLPHESFRLDDAIARVFLTQGAGVVELRHDIGDPRLDAHLESRAQFGDDPWAAGETIPIARIAASTGQTLVIPSLERGERFRSNVAIASRGEQSARVRITVRDADGVERDHFSLTLPSRGGLQVPLAVDGGALRAEISVESGTVSAGASVVDATSGDARWIEAAIVPSQSTTLTIPAAIKQEGANGSHWSTTLNLINQSDDAVVVEGVVAEGGGSSGPHHDFLLGPRRAEQFPDVLSLLGARLGTLTLHLPREVLADAFISPAESLTQRESFVESPLEDAIASGDSRVIGTVEISTNARLNVGVAASGDVPSTALIEIRGGSGEIVASRQINVSPGRMMQFPILLDAPLYEGSVVVRALSGGPILAWSSIVSAATNDSSITF